MAKGKRNPALFAETSRSSLVALPVEQRTRAQVPFQPGKSYHVQASNPTNSFEGTARCLEAGCGMVTLVGKMEDERVLKIRVPYGSVEPSKVGYSLGSSANIEFYSRDASQYRQLKRQLP